LLMPLAEVLDVFVAEMIIGEKIDVEKKSVEIMDKTLLNTLDNSQRMAKRTQKRIVIAACATLICVIVFVCGAFIYQIPVTYSPDKIWAEQIDSSKIVVYSKDNCTSSFATYKDDEVYFYLKTTLYAKLFTQGSGSYIVDKDVINLYKEVLGIYEANKVFYLKGKEEAVLIWER